MKLDIKGLVLLAAVGLLLAAGGYWLGTSRTPAPAAQAPAPAAPQPAPVVTPQPAVSPDAPLPPAHPLLPQQPTAQPVVDGKRRFTHFQVGNRNVKSMFADGDQVWVGTSGGVVRYDLNSDTHRLFDNRSGLLSNGIFYVGRIQGRLTVGTYGGGMSMLQDDGETWDNYNIQHGMGDAFVYDVLEASNGDIWIATWSGANRIKGGRLDDRDAWETFTVANTGGGLPNDWVYGLEQDADGVIWMATEGGLTRFENEQWQNWQHDDGLGAPYEKVKASIQFRNDPAKFSSHHARQKVEQGLEDVDIAYNPNYIVALAIDPRDGAVWVGTWGGGLSRYDGESWSSYTVDEGLPANHIFMLRFDSQQRLWIGTSQGLALRGEDGSYKVMNTQDGLFSNNVFSMDEASDGTLWIGSFGGITRLWPEQE